MLARKSILALALIMAMAISQVYSCSLCGNEDSHSLPQKRNLMSNDDDDDDNGLNSFFSFQRATAQDASNMRILIDWVLSRGKCQFAPFGAMLVREATNEIVCYGLNDAFNSPTLHGEIAAIENCSRLYPGNGFNTSFWSGLTLYTTGEPCPMCQSAVQWAKISRVVYSTTIQTLINSGWTQIRISSAEVNFRSIPKPDGFLNTKFVRGLYANRTDPLFAWQFNPNGPCPTGCTKANGFCVEN